MQKDHATMNCFYDKYDFFPLSILDSPLDQVKIFIETVLENWNKSICYDIVDLEKVCPAPYIPSGGAHFTKFMLLEPKCNPYKTALFVNLQDAYGSLIHILNHRYKIQTFTVRLSNEKSDNYKYYGFNYKSTDNHERVVYSMQDPRWTFFQTGKIQLFEEVDYYNRKRIKDRMNKEIINEYLSRLNYPIWSEDFYQSEKKGIYFERLSY